MYKKILPLLAAALFYGCDQPKTITQPAPISLDPNTTIAQLAEVFSPQTVMVEGYALVGGLSGTGSSEVPSGIQNYLQKYIASQFPQGTDTEGFIKSANTAAVKISGLMPAAGKNQTFDVRIESLGTQTTSLEGGVLWGADLYPKGMVGTSNKTLATAEGPVFVNKLDANSDLKTGYIIGGGLSKEEYPIKIAVTKPDYRVATLIRNRLIERYGRNTAKAVSPGQVSVKIPDEYKNQQDRFADCLRVAYILDNQQINTQRIETLAAQLKSGQNPGRAALTLEAIGKPSVSLLELAASMPDENVRFEAAKALLNLGGEKGYDILAQIAADTASRYRIEALDAITVSAKRKDSIILARNLLRDDDINVAIAAYKHLQKMEDMSIETQQIANKFFIDQVSISNRNLIYVCRSGQPRIAIFGSSLRLKPDVFIETDNGIVINAVPEQNYVSLIRKHPSRQGIVINLKSTYQLSSVIRTLGEEPKTDRQGNVTVGLNLSYDDIAVILRTLVEKDAIAAEFLAGPIPKDGTK